jgi:hypothetical protein
MVIMIYKDFYSDIVEMALPLSTAKQYTKISGGKYKTLLDHVFNGKHRIYIPFDVPINQELVDYVITRYRTETSYHRLIGLLQNNTNTQDGYFTLSNSTSDDDMSVGSFKNYVDNVCYFVDNKTGEVKKDKNGNKIPYKLGKVIQKYLPNETELLKVFNEDPYRQIFGKKLKIAISRHPYDIAGMSTDRNWTSCMNLGTDKIVYKGKNDDTKPIKGSNAQYVKDEVSDGTIVAYLITDNDNNIKKPISRCLIKPFASLSSSDEIYYNVSKIYGVPISQFKNELRKWADNNINKEIKSKKYFKLGGYYDSEDEVTKKGINLYGKITEYINDVRRELKNTGVAIEDVSLTVNSGEPDIIDGDIEYDLGGDGVMGFSQEKADALASVLSNKYKKLTHIQFDYNQDMYYLRVTFTLRVRKTDYSELEKFFSEMKQLVVTISENRKITEISVVQSNKTNVDQLFSRLLKKNFPSHLKYVGKPREQIQEWIDEYLAIPLVIDLKNGKMEAYDNSMEQKTIELNNEYEDVQHFLKVMHLFGTDKKYNYIMVSPDMIVEYLFGNSNQYNLPTWDMI